MRELVTINRKKNFGDCCTFSNSYVQQGYGNISKWSTTQPNITKKGVSSILELTSLDDTTSQVRRNCHAGSKKFEKSKVYYNTMMIFLFIQNWTISYISSKSLERFCIVKRKSKMIKNEFDFLGFQIHKCCLLLYQQPLLLSQIDTALTITVSTCIVMLEIRDYHYQIYGDKFKVIWFLSRKLKRDTVSIYTDSYYHVSL
ncbi:hypothetical protein ACTFIR_012775 [Dictyostelium discoideum]